MGENCKQRGRSQFPSLFNCVLFFVLIIINRVQFRVNMYL